MSWLGLANNQTISFNNLQDAVTTGYLYALTTIPSSLEQITKADASTYVSIDTAYSPYASKASNQLVIKSNIKPVFQYSGTLYYNIDFKFFWEGWDSSSNACSNYSSGSSATVNWNGTLGIGTLVFIPNCNLDLSSLPYYVIYYGGTAYWVTFLDEYYDPTTNTCAYSIVDIAVCTCEITVNLNITGGGGGYITVTNQDTFVSYTITAADASGVGYVPGGSFYDVTDFGLTVPCTSPLVATVSPTFFSGGCGDTVNIDIACV
jgi:hypothetical protein